MFRKTIFILSGLLGLITLTVIGCGGGSSSNTSTPATVQKQDGYYNVTLDFTNTSHREVGRQYALAIRQAFPGYEANLKSSLRTTYKYLQMDTDHKVSWNDLINRSKAIFANLDQEYKDEILGMQDVFSYNVNNVDSDLLSKDEFLVYLLGADVMRTLSCSASAAFGSATVSGNTVIGRNADGLTEGKTTYGQMQAITTFKQGSKTITTIGPLGFLGAISVFNKNRMFGAILDASTFVAYPTYPFTNTIRSYPYDLRYSFENFTSISDSDTSNPNTVETYIGCLGILGADCKEYAYNHNVFLADQTRAGTLENQTNPCDPDGTNCDLYKGNRRIRWSSSVLSTEGSSQTAQDWKYDDARRIDWAHATVNDYRLVHNFYTGSLTPDNVNRWTSFKDCYLKSQGMTGSTCDLSFPSNHKITTSELKAIMGYPGHDGIRSQRGGAIFISEPMGSYPNPSVPQKRSITLHDPVEGPAYATMQSMVMDMGTMELWVYFADSSTYLPINPVTESLWKKISNPIY